MSYLVNLCTLIQVHGLGVVIPVVARDMTIICLRRVKSRPS